MSGATVHRLGTAVLLILAAVAGATALVGVRREKGGVRRLRGALGVERARRAPLAAPRWVGGLLREWGVVAAIGLGVAVVVGGVLGGLAGFLAGCGSRRWLRGREGAADGSMAVGGPEEAQMPLCADLMAACLTAGATPGEAAGAVGRCLGGSLGVALIRAEAELRLGGDPVECWDRFGRLPAARGMGRCLARASTTGSAPVAEMSRLAADYRAAQGRSALARARRAAVLATAPLGVCFLPAFLLVGVAPVVMGLAGAVLGGRMT